MKVLAEAKGLVGNPDGDIVLNSSYERYFNYGNITFCVCFSI